MPKNTSDNESKNIEEIFVELAEMTVLDKVENKVEEDILENVYSLIRKKCNIDFTHYKQNTILRSISKRIKATRQDGVVSYLSYLKERPEEVEILCKSFLIDVTRFFREKDAFDFIKRKVIPNIFSKKSDNSPIRIWCIGCSTGEEAYSLAILFKEYMESENINIEIRIFATDIDNEAIEHARTGIYSNTIEEDVPSSYLDKYFVKTENEYQIIKQIREIVIFSYHNIIHNPPFSKIDFLSCRNMLIYFKPMLQKRALSLFQYSLNQGGTLFLGISETISKSNNAFAIIDSKWKIYKCNSAEKQPFIDNISINNDNVIKTIKIPDNSFLKRREKVNIDLEEIHMKLIEEYLPSSVIIDENNEIVQVCGDANKYLKISTEKASLDILKMVPKSLAMAISMAITKVKKDMKPVKYKDFKITIKEETHRLNLIIKPFKTIKNTFLTMIVFEDLIGESVFEEFSEEFFNMNLENKYNERIASLERELHYTREELQNTLDEVAVSSEELQSSNEELLVSNEELHSTNEELQSVNEELTVVNNQYQYTIQELTDLNNDMSNFLASTDIGTLFLDRDLYVRKFTPAITKEINLIEQDIGRPVSHISHNFVSHNLIEYALRVIEGVEKTIEKEVQSNNGKWYIIKYQPYKIPENEIKGIVISLVDITVLKRSEGNERILREKLAFDTLKTEFFSNISHELKTPLNVINCTIQLLGKYVKDRTEIDIDIDKLSRHTNIMKQNCYRLLRLVNNIIDITKVDTGFFDIEYINCNIVNIVEEITLSVALFIESKGISLLFDTDVEEKIIACDPDQIERIMLNLLSNAIKFTYNNGNINVNIYDKGDKVVISVSDTGVGIPEDKLNLIFERFRQVDNSITKKCEGSGIGLSLVKSLVEMHDGNISVISKCGVGSEFIIELPAKTIVNENNKSKKADEKSYDNIEKIKIEFSDIYGL